LIAINTEIEPFILYVGDDPLDRGKDNLGRRQTNSWLDALTRRVRLIWPARAARVRDRVVRKSFMSKLATRHIARLLLVGATVALPVGGTGALEGTDSAAVAKLPVARVDAPREPVELGSNRSKLVNVIDPKASERESSGNPVTAFPHPALAVHAGIDAGSSDARASDSRTVAVEALKRAADRGEALALWRLGNAYAAGDGVPRDDQKAFDYFAQIVAGYDEDSPSRRERAIVAGAFVALGAYGLKGIENSKVQPDPDLGFALQMFRTAATNFGDANAQYYLARMYLEGVGIGKDGQQAARWLRLAADKGHVQAQARLGQMLFSGQESVKPHRAQGLMWLTLAREAAIDAEKDKWIIDLYDGAMASANDEDRQVALAYLEDHLKRRN
jgi:TPR repeat protein